MQESKSQETLKKSAWDVDDYRCLYAKGQDMLQQLNMITNALESSSLPSTMEINDVQDCNIPLFLTELRSSLLQFQKNLFKKRRKPASYILVALISESLRRRKPYALPIQCIPHSGLKDMQVRHFSNVIKEEMVKAGLTPKGKSHAFTYHLLYTNL